MIYLLVTLNGGFRKKFKVRKSQMHKWNSRYQQIIFSLSVLKVRKLGSVPF